MGNRRKAREYALYMLYSYDVTGLNPDYILKNFYADLERAKAGSKTKEYAEKLFKKVLEKKSIIDKTIESKSQHWKLSRMSTIDRNILRIATYELLFEDLDPPIVINEAIEIGKKYGDSESGVFINGILDAINKDLK
ncbi:N utilization substance protein B [Thermotomaculum hydrothermale]|uniref:Transcription antitermination protein NusB n=1 Tax=Thermotomaculum hydrothermale TaxID=981385 RepID=A0A7R6PT79_9BACT|nr:transcription antitermination factor NusB [Thermotomaculum hydrothermale]BBB32202.1 N utilization substance protein B [Thermotomaculum hydrothermale]